MIIQLLAVDAKSTVIQSCKQIFNYLYIGKDVTKLPSVIYIHWCRIYAIIINEFIAAMKLGLVSWWPNMYHNGTSCKQFALYSSLFRISDKRSNKMDPPMIALSCTVMMNRSAEGICEAINSKVWKILVCFCLMSFIITQCCFF